MTVYPNPVSPHEDKAEDTSKPPEQGSVDPTVDRVNSEDALHELALRQLKKKADFRTHVMIYVLVNGMFVLIWAFTGMRFFWPIILLALWGIGLVANAMEVYRNPEPSEDDIAREMDRLRRH